jgi:hypothetical protein
VAVVHQSSATGTAPNGGTLTINKPTGTVANDVLIAAFTLGSGGHVASSPSGWVAVLGGGASDTYAVYYKVAGGSEPASYSWTSDNPTGGGAGGISRYSGVDTVTPLDVAGTSTFGFTSPATAGPITTVTANAMVIGGVFELSTYTVTPPAGLTERWEAGPGDNVGNEHASGIQAVAGSTGTLSWPMSTSTSSRGWAAALKGANPSQTITASFVSSAEQVFSATVLPTLYVNASFVPTGEQVFAPQVLTGGQVGPNFVASGEQVFTPSVQVTAGRRRSPPTSC